MKRKLLTIAAALMCAMGAWADGYTDYLNTANGYEEVTSTSQLADANYYYVFASAENPSLIINITDKSDGLPTWYEGTAKILCYKTLSSNPIADATNFFIIQDNDGYEMFNVGYNPNTKFQTHTDKAYLWVNTGETNSNDYTKFIPSYDGANGYWTFQNNMYPDAEHKDGYNWYGFLGPWTAKYVAEGEHIAGNRTNEGEDLAGHFKIYRIKRTRYEKDVLRNNPVVTDTYLQNPSFELSGSGTPLTADVKQSDGSSLTIYGWTETLGNTDYNNREIISNSTKGSNSNHSAAITAADGSYHFFMRRSWNDGNSSNFTYKSNSATYEAGHYTVTYSYILEEGTQQGHTSTGSYMTLQALEGSTVIGSGRVNAKNWGTTTPYTNTWATSSFSFDLAEEKTLSLAVVITPRGGNKTEVHVDNFIVTYSPFADADDYAELTTAISTAEGYTLGFDAGEYASYNVLPILNAAKAIDQNANNAYSTVRELIEALNAIAPNAAEVDAVYNGNFAEELEGWTRTNPWGQQKIDLSGDYATAYYNQPGSLKYGSNTDYKMPLKADTYYTLKVAYRAHQSDKNTNVTVSVLKSSEGLSDKGLSWTTNTSTWTKETVTFKTGTAGDYVLTLANYDNTWMTGVSLLRATAAEIKPFLNTEITTATATRNTYSEVENPSAFQRPTSAGETFAAAIEAAQEVYDNASATASQVATAVTTLETAQATYQAAIVPPTSSQAYIVANTTANGALKVATERVTVDANAAVFFTAVTGGYVISNADDKYIYKTTGDAWTLSTTANEGDAYVITSVNPVDGGFTIQGAKGLFGTDATAAGSTVYANKAQANNGIWTITEATTVNMNVKAGKWGTFIAPFDVTIPANISAYTATGVNNNKVTLEAVETTIPANTPVLLRNETGELISETFYGVSTATADSYTDAAGLLTGVYTNANINGDNRYVLQTPTEGENEGVQAFYKVNGDFYATPYKCYLTYAGGGVKMLSFDFGDATGINTVQGSGFKVQDSKIYNLAGQRVDGSRFTVNGSGLKTGIYIVNGKKVLVK